MQFSTLGSGLGRFVLFEKAMFKGISLNPHFVKVFPELK